MLIAISGELSEFVQPKTVLSRIIHGMEKIMVIHKEEQDLSEPADYHSRLSLIL